MEDGDFYCREELDFTDVFAPSLVFARGGGLPCAKQTVPRSEKNAGIQVLRYAPHKTPLVLISDNEIRPVNGAEREGEPLEELGGR